MLQDRGAQELWAHVVGCDFRKAGIGARHAGGGGGIAGVRRGLLDESRTRLEAKPHDSTIDVRIAPVCLDTSKRFDLGEQRFELRFLLPA